MTRLVDVVDERRSLEGVSTPVRIGGLTVAPGRLSDGEYRGIVEGAERDMRVATSRASGPSIANADSAGRKNVSHGHAQRVCVRFIDDRPKVVRCGVELRRFDRIGRPDEGRFVDDIRQHQPERIHPRSFNEHTICGHSKSRAFDHRRVFRRRRQDQDKFAPEAAVAITAGVEQIVPTTALPNDGRGGSHTSLSQVDLALLPSVECRGEHARGTASTVRACVRVRTTCPTA